MDLNKIEYNYDLLIVGAGGAGLASAIFASENNALKIAVASKVHPLKSHTVAAQGGINASLGNITTDHWKWHAYDTIKASDWIADQDSVEEMCKNAPNIINMLNKLGVEFDTLSDGRINQKIYGGQSANYGKGKLAYRACFSKDRTGHSIMHKLYEEAIKKNIIFHNFNFVLDLICYQERCYGAVCLDISNGNINIIKAKNTIIATGGYSQIYATATSAALCTGDGNGLAARAGLSLQDMEFIQFHPTALSKIGILITEAARSAGGTLLNSKQERFMEKYAPKFKELAARDIVARAIATEINNGNGAGKNKDHVWLNLTHLSREFITRNLPTVFENCKEFAKLDPSHELIPIAPAAHYTMGGIPTNSNCQAIRYQNGVEKVFTSLYAVGEAACISVHGAGRLGCNSLLDLIVFADKAVKSLEIKNISLDSKEIELQIISKFQSIFTKKAIDIEKLKQKLKNTMSKHIGVFRSRETLTRAIYEIQKIEQQFINAGISDKSLIWNIELQHYLELENMLISAKATANSALWRNESRGAHWREDYQSISEKYYGHTIINNLSDTPDLCLRPIRIVKDNVDFYQPQQRIY